MNNPEPANYSQDLSFISRFLEVLEPIEGRKPGVAVMRRKVAKMLKQAKYDGTLENMFAKWCISPVFKISFRLATPSFKLLWWKG
jgi:hypothetical protein